MSQLLRTDTFPCDCGEHLPWPTREQDTVCPCGNVWEHDTVDIGAGARLKASRWEGSTEAYGAQLAARVGEMIPDQTTDERLELLAAMDPDDMAASLAWLVSAFPQIFDFSLVRDRGLVERLQERIDEADQDEDDDEVFCGTCSASIGIFYGRQSEGWLHFRGAGTAGSPVEIFDADHAPVVSWGRAGAR